MIESCGREMKMKSAFANLQQWRGVNFCSTEFPLKFLEKQTRKRAASPKPMKRGGKGRKTFSDFFRLFALISSCYFFYTVFMCASPSDFCRFESFLRQNGKKWPKIQTTNNDSSSAKSFHFCIRQPASFIVLTYLSLNLPNRDFKVAAWIYNLEKIRATSKSLFLLCNSAMSARPFNEMELLLKWKICSSGMPNIKNLFIFLSKKVLFIRISSGSWHPFVKLSSGWAPEKIAAAKISAHSTDWAARRT